jgi:hypothetical protein
MMSANKDNNIIAKKPISHQRLGLAFGPISSLLCWSADKVVLSVSGGICTIWGKWMR